jgi:F-type H+-transporting ATPase subunit b
MAETAASGPGMPQLDFTTFSNQIFWLVVTMVVLYFVMSRVALPRIAAVLADRRRHDHQRYRRGRRVQAEGQEAEKA